MRSEKMLRVIAGFFGHVHEPTAVLVLVFFHFRPGLRRLVCYLYLFKPSVETTAAYIITTSCAPDQPCHLLKRFSPPLPRPMIPSLAVLGRLHCTLLLPSTYPEPAHIPFSAAWPHQKIVQPSMRSGPKIAPSFRARNRDAQCAYPISGPRVMRLDLRPELGTIFVPPRNQALAGTVA